MYAGSKHRNKIMMQSKEALLVWLKVLPSSNVSEFREIKYNDGQQAILDC